MSTITLLTYYIIDLGVRTFLQIQKDWDSIPNSEELGEGPKVKFQSKLRVFKIV